MITGIDVGQNVGKRQKIEGGKQNRIKASAIYNVAESITGNPEPSKSSSALAPGLSQKPLLSLSHARYGLPQTLVKNFASLGINSIYPWQSPCLLRRGLLSGDKNLVYTAPTGGGKSLVADVLMLKRVITDPIKKAIPVLPYVALVQEKLKWLRKVVEGVRKQICVPGQDELPTTDILRWRTPHSSSIGVVGFFGSSKARAAWSDVDIAVCTIEKVSSQ